MSKGSLITTCDPILMEGEGQQPKWQFSTETNKTIDCKFAVMKINIENTLLI